MAPRTMESDGFSNIPMPKRKPTQEEIDEFVLHIETKKSAADATDRRRTIAFARAGRIDADSMRRVIDEYNALMKAFEK